MLGWKESCQEEKTFEEMRSLAKDYRWNNRLSIRKPLTPTTLAQKESSEEETETILSPALSCKHFNAATQFAKNCSIFWFNLFKKKVAWPLVSSLWSKIWGVGMACWLWNNADERGLKRLESNHKARALTPHIGPIILSMNLLLW